MNALKKRLKEAIINGRAMHSFLITSADEEQTDELMRLAAVLIIYGNEDTEALAYCPDYMEYSGAISIGQLRDEIRPELYKQTYEGKNRAVAFRNANLLSIAVQNAMLKILEEPPKGTHFILTGNEYGLLPTIRSRCLIVRPGLASVEELVSAVMARGAGRSDAMRFANMSGGVIARAVRLYTDEDFRALRIGAIDAFLLSIRGIPAYKWAKAKRERVDWMEANEIMLLCCHDMLKEKCGLELETALDRAAEMKKLCPDFTIGDIGCIIDMLVENAERLSTNAGGSMCFDRLFTELAQLWENKKQGVRA